MRTALGACLAILISGCSGGDFDTGAAAGDASVDASGSDTGESTTDSTIVDSSSEDSSIADTVVTSDSGTDTGVRMDAKPDVVVIDVIATETDTVACHSFWCGCGTCVPKDIACTKDATLGCPLGCASAPCPAAEMTGVCTTIGDRCQRNFIMGEIACYHTADCPPGNCCKGAGSPPTHGTCITAPDSSCGP
ncbi:MAG: hypothetical protein ACXWUG_12985 [Polyangiales bacterium]